MSNSFHNIIRRAQINPSYVFFCLFLLTAPLQTRHIFNADISYVNGHFNEWLSYSIFASDIFLFITIGLWVYEEIVSRGTNRPSIVPRGTNRPSIVPRGTNRLTTIALAGFLIIFALISILRRGDINIGLYGTVKIAEFIILFAYVVIELYSQKKRLFSYIFIVFSGIIQAIIAIVQYLWQHDLGLRILGENLISRSINGIAKVDIASDQIIRAYGTFSHPAVLAGYLIICLFLAVFLIFNSYSGFSIALLSKIGRTIGYIGIICLPMALIFSFSRLSWIAVVVSMILVGILFFTKKRNSKRFKINSKQIWIATAIIILVIISALSLNSVKERLRINEIINDKAVEIRLFYNEKAVKMIKDFPFSGVGQSNFVATIPIYLNNIQWWQYQPVHNVFLLIASEIGLIALAIFISIIIFILYNCLKYFNQEERDNRLEIGIWLAIIIAMLIIMLGDHYYWSLQAGKIMLWLSLGYALAIKNVPRGTFKKQDSK